MAKQRRGVQLEGVQEPVHPGDRGLAVAALREVDRVAQPHPGPVWGDRADSVELLQQRQQEPRWVPGAVEEHHRRPGTLLQEMDPTAGIHLDVAAGYRRSGQQAFVHLVDLGGMGLLGVHLRPAAHCYLPGSMRLGSTVGAGWRRGVGETPNMGVWSGWVVLPRCG
jgi:hypothetical protein